MTMRRTPIHTRSLLRQTALFGLALIALAQTRAALAQPDGSAGPAATAQPVSIKRSVGPVDVTVSLDSDRFPMAEPFDVRIRIEAASGVAFGMPEYEGMFGAFEVVEQTQSEIDCGDDLHCSEVVLTLNAGIPGDAEIPPLQIAYAFRTSGADDVTQDVFEVEPIPIVIENTLADMKAPAGIPMPFSYAILWWAVGIVAALIVIGGVVFYVLTRKRRAPLATLAQPLAPYDWAMRELNRLIAEDLLGKGQVQAFYYRINLLLRQYIEKRFHVLAGEQTSEEFLRRVPTMAALSPEHQETLRAFVAACDPVKYARHEPTQQETDWVLQTAREFIESTRSGDNVVAPPVIAARPEVRT